MKWSVWGFWILLMLTAFGTKSQHPPMFSQYMFNGLVINPAYTGSRDALSLIALYRHQWAGFQGAPRTQTFSAHSPLKNNRNNFGINIVHDQLGVSDHTMLYGTYAYRIDMGPRAGRLAFGLQGGLSLIEDRWTEVVTNLPGDLVFGANSPTFVVPRFGAGLYWDHPKYFFGLSTPYLLQYNNAVYSSYVQNSVAYRPWLATAGFVARLNPDLLLKPSVLFKFVAPTSMQVDINMNLVIKEAFWIGGSYRTSDGIVAMFEWQANPQFRFGYSFDYGLGALQKFNSGSHELMLRYEFGYRMKSLSPRYF